MNVHNFKPVLRLEKSIIRYYRLGELGQKLVEVAVDLSLATIGIITVNAAIAVFTHRPWQSFFVLMVPWILILGWAWWRFFLRYTRLIDRHAFLCIDGRPKNGTELSKIDFGPLKVCTKCEKSRLALIALDNQLDLLVRSIRDRKALDEGTSPALPHPIVHRVYPDEKDGT